MGRIQISAEAISNPNHTVVVGWDSPLETFFAQVFDYTETDDDDCDPIIEWIGISAGEIPTVNMLADMLEPYCFISPEIASQLQKDYENRTEPTALQKWVGLLDLN